MSNYLPTTTEDKKENSFKNLWKRPGGTFAKVTGWAAIIAMVFAFCKYLLPFLVAAAANIIILILELVALFIIIYVLTNKTFRRACSLGWLQLMRKLYGLIVNIDPINILQNSIDEMKKQMDTVHDNVTKLQSVLESMKRKLAEYKTNFENNITKQEIVREKIKEAANPEEALKYKAKLQLINNDITRGESQIRSQQKRIDTSEKYLEIMKKLEIKADYEVRDAESKLAFTKDEYEQAKIQQSTMSSITSILKGGMTSSMEKEIAMENISETINNSIAEINRMLDGSNDILINFELDSEMNSAKADEIVRVFDENGFDIFKTTEDEPQITFINEMYAIGEGKKEEEMVKVERTSSKKYF